MRYWSFLRAHPLDLVFTAVLLLVGFIMLGSIVYVALDPIVSTQLMIRGEIPPRTRFFPPYRPSDIPSHSEVVLPTPISFRPLDYRDYATFGVAGFLLSVPPLFHFYRYRKWKTESN